MLTGYIGLDYLDLDLCDWITLDPMWTMLYYQLIGDKNARITLLEIGTGKGCVIMTAPPRVGI